MLDRIRALWKYITTPPIQTVLQQPLPEQPPQKTYNPMVNYHPPFPWHKWKVPYQQPLLPASSNPPEMR